MPGTPRLVLVAVALLASIAHAEPIDLINPAKPAGGWRLGMGLEFPGAKASFGFADEKFEGRPVLKLDTDFTGGGQYVDLQVDLPKVPVDTISFWIHAPAGADHLPVRIIDGSGQVHQLRLRVSDRGGWQKITFPVHEYFAKLGTPDALDLTTQYEKWSGANDGKWHQPGRLFTILGTRSLGSEKATLLIRDVQLHPRADRVVTVERAIPLDRSLDAGRADWQLNLGREFKGADGSLAVLDDLPEAGNRAMRLSADFTGGGQYVGILRRFDDLDLDAVRQIRMRMRSDNASKYTVRMVDGSGQTHQRKAIAFEADGKWRDVVIDPRQIAGGEHWGGANDGRWHDPIRLVEFMLTVRSDEANNPVVDIADMTLDATITAERAAGSATITFDDAGDAAIPGGWERAGDANLTRPGRGGKGAAIELAREVDAINDATGAVGAPLAVSPGLWRFAFAQESAMHSPDNSYNVTVSLDVFDRGGKKLDSIPLGAGFGKSDWSVVSTTSELPAGASTARLRIAMNKTFGRYRLDDFEATPLRLGAVERLVERIEISSDAPGNLFLPGKPIAMNVRVKSARPLDPAARTLRWDVRDGLGARAMEPGEVELTERDGRTYEATIHVPAERLQVGRFYELHVAVAPGAEQVSEYSGLAVLPEAPSKKYDPGAIPFTIRNWDGRVAEYPVLADRLGHRTIGIWGGWSSKPPYTANLNNRERVRELGAGWAMGTEAASVERNGFKVYSEQALREGMTNFLKAYADEDLQMITLGNEPHGKGQTVLDNVKAYRIVYEAIKAFDPDITVFGTSVEPNREYFEAGYFKHLDAYDFHIYESYENVRRTMREYRKLMEEFDAVKPIHSTELGLNSQGQTRRVVASEMLKKCSVFFAEGGATVSWFTIQYPDHKGKARGSLGDTHCVFDCKYSLYNPRLDAITYYHLINGLLDKKFVGERKYDDGTQAFLFRDSGGRCMAVVWNDGQRADVRMDLSVAGEVKRVLIDGSEATLRTRDGLTLTVSDEPVVLVFDGAEAKLPEKLEAPSVRVVDAPESVKPGETINFMVEGEEVRVSGPATWSIRAEAAGGKVKVTVDVPAETTAREAEFAVHAARGGEVRVRVRVER